MHYAQKYQRRLKLPVEAARLVRSGDTIVWSLGDAAARGHRRPVRAGELRDIKACYLNPLEHSARTVLATDIISLAHPDLRDGRLREAGDRHPI